MKSQPQLRILMRGLVLAILCTPAMSAIAQDVPRSLASDPEKAKLAADALKARAAANARRAKEAEAVLTPLAAKPTPKTADGHPDLSGLWVNPTEEAANVVVEGNRHDLVFGAYGVDGIIPSAKINDPNDVELTLKLSPEEQLRQKLAARRPEYKPEYEAKVEAMIKDPSHSDPTSYLCQQPGVPRIGAPTYILQTPTDIFLLYSQRSTTRPSSTFRIVPIDGKPRPKGVDPSPMGDSVGRWEGDTLVVNVTNLDDSTWFAGDGTFHTLDMRVTERLTRKGDTLQYSATVEDPNVLVKPYEMTTKPMIFRLGGPKDTPEPDYPCEQDDKDHFVTSDH